ncbi:MAG TPA: DUF6508 domain-containing protein [Trueperaceae bacterium]|nr:DUF6508 domain-containing protein [Trueperaceae bacterium]
MDWLGWAGTREARTPRIDLRALENATVAQLVKPFTLIIRQEHFAEGPFLGAFEIALAQRMLGRVREINRAAASG